MSIFARAARQTLRASDVESAVRIARLESDLAFARMRNESLMCSLADARAALVDAERRAELARACLNTGPGCDL